MIFNWINFNKSVFNRNSYRTMFYYMYGRLTQDQVGKRNLADGGDGE